MPYKEIIEDAVYIDSVNGVAGILYPIGTAGNPVSNAADALTIAAARHLEKLVIVGASSVTFSSSFTLNVIGNGQCDITISTGVAAVFTGDLVCNDLTVNADATSVNIWGDLKATNNVTIRKSTAVYGDVYTGGSIALWSPASFTVRGNLHIANQVSTFQNGAFLFVYGNVFAGSFSNVYGGVTIYGTLTCGMFEVYLGDQNFYGTVVANSMSLTGASGTVSFRKDVITGYISISTGKTVNIWGDLILGSHMNPSSTGTCTIQVARNLYCRYNFTATNSTITVGGNCEIVGNFTNSGTFTVNGIGIFRGTITNTGTLTFKGEQQSVSVSVDAINASETNFLNLTALSNTSLKFMVDNLRLKCADPGANTVNVRLYELVNNVLTVVATFAITNANFGTYFSLVDMFGLRHLKGTQLKITVQATAGGPYAITGQYEYAIAK